MILTVKYTALSRCQLCQDATRAESWVSGHRPVWESLSRQWCQASTSSGASGWVQDIGSTAPHIDQSLQSLSRKDEKLDSMTFLSHQQLLFIKTQKLIKKNLKLCKIRLLMSQKRQGMHGRVNVMRVVLRWSQSSDNTHHWSESTESRCWTLTETHCLVLRVNVW